MKNALCLLLLSFSLQRIQCQSMESIESSVQKKPGETLTLSCRGSGFSFDCCSMHWIKQQAGKPLVWIGRVYSDGSGHDYAESFKGRAEITRDNSKSMVYLKLSGLTAEDSAMYYCALFAFDYWGKGTRVTVTNEEPKPPVVFQMSQCTSSTDSLILGCLASEFSPDNSVNFRWSSNGNNITNVIQHSTQNKLKFSYITITKEQRDQSDIMCTADHPTKQVSKAFSTAPTVGLVLVPTEKNTFAMCVIEDFFPKNITVRWKENDSETQSPTKLEYQQNMNGLYTALSLYKLSKTANANTEYTCEVSHIGETFNKKQIFRAKFTLMLKPPNESEMFINNKIVLEAVVSGELQNAVKEASVSCKMDNVPINIVSQETVLNDTSQYVRIHKVTVDTIKWFNGGRVTCTTQDTLNNRDIKQEIHINKGDGGTPSVKIYKPDEIDTEYISHVCEVSSPNLCDVYIMWKVSNKPYTEGKSSGPIQQQGSTSVLSIFTISKTEYEDPTTTIACAVIHANMKNTTSPLQTSTSKSKQPLSKACECDYSGS